MELMVGDVIEGEVVDFASGGEGVLKIDTYPVFVPFAIKGEYVRASITFAKKDCAFADLIEVLSMSNDRIKPRCPYYSRCGGCDMQHIKYEKQLDIKKENVVRALKKVGGIECDVNDTVSLTEWEYRNKLSMPFGYKKKTNRVVLGFYEKKSHAVVPMKWCALHGQWCADVIEDVCEWANENHVSVYDEIAKKGLLRHVVARMLDTLSLTLVINGNSLPKLDELVKKLHRHFDDFCIYISVNTKVTNAIFGDNATLVYGNEKKQNLGKFSAVVSPLSFLQVNNVMRDKIYDDVCKNLQNFDGDIVELYSGVGLLTAQIAKRLENATITSVEIVQSASKNANALIKSLGLQDRVKCVCDDALNYVKSLANDKKTQDAPILAKEIVESPLYLGEAPKKSASKVLILDPPRKGCDSAVLQVANEAQFEKIIYISCNPQTLARDLKTLLEKYTIESVTPYDMFPQTMHVETLVCFVRKSK